MHDKSAFGLFGLKLVPMLQCNAAYPQFIAGACPNKLPDVDIMPPMTSFTPEAPILKKKWNFEHP